jgi:DNA-binding SARP family transcriptional activator/TolB-like protein
LSIGERRCSCCRALRRLESVGNNRGAASEPVQRDIIGLSSRLQIALSGRKTLRLRVFGGLWIENPDADSDAGRRPRPLALLAILALAGPNGASRDRVLGVLWPESEEERARQSLSQLIYSLKRELGVDVAASGGGAGGGGGARLRLDSNQISSDVGDFRAAIAAKNWQAAAVLYGGAFLDGFYLADAPEFERWTESERASLATEGIRALEIAARDSAEKGRREEAAEHWHRLTRIDPASSRIAASYIEALAALGDRSAALAHAKAHADFLRREFETEPDRAFQHSLARLREAEPVRESSLLVPASVPPAGSPPPETLAVDPPPSGGARPKALGRRRISIGAASVVAISAIAVFGWRATSARAPARPVIAVGRIRDLVAPDSAAVSAVSSEMLATSLSRLTDLPVVANSRMLELTPRGGDTSRSALTEAARRAGATEIIEGELIPLPGRQLRLEIRRVDMARGLVRRGYRISGSDRVALFDSVTALVAADFRLDAPSGSVAEVTTRSPIAYRFYEEGLRAYYLSDLSSARRLFDSAVREDSTFAMASYYAWLVARTSSDQNEPALAARAIALAPRAPPRDRLLILAHIGSSRADRRAIAPAETLAAKYGRDPEALLVATAVIQDDARAVELLNRVIAMDSAASRGSAILCHLCTALIELTERYKWLDSGEAVQRTLRRWHALRPSDATPWGTEADWLIGLGRRGEAEAAMRRYESLGGVQGNVHLEALVQSLRLDDFETPDAACANGLVTPDTDELRQYRWFCSLSLRMQGRYREALALAREGRIPKSHLVIRRMPRDEYLDAILDMEAGRPLVAADEFAAIHRPGDDLRHRGDTIIVPEGFRARYATWTLTLSATAAVAGGDTLRARRMVDSIERTGRRSLFGRDPLLHHFVRGLLLSRSEQHEAALAEFRAAIQSPTFGYSRINYEIGRSALAVRRPREGIPIVQAALRGGIEGSGFYVTRTELHELLARLFDANQQRDSAAAHYAIVERAWRSADPFLKGRYDAARQGR